MHNLSMKRQKRATLHTKVFRLLPPLLLTLVYIPLVTTSAPNLNIFSFGSSNVKNLPELPSTILKLQKIYTSHPPHDTQLYRTLRVTPNATTAEIQKSYRKLSLQFHPDKQRKKSHAERQKSAQELEKIQQAYRILSDDATRLLYHKYGLQDLSTAVRLLTGYQNTHRRPSTEELELLQLMGFPPPPQSTRPSPPLRIGQSTSADEQQQQQQLNQDQRVQFLAATILERIRPLVEGTLSERAVADFIATECDRLKQLPLGAHILRCVGRAYRHAGQGYCCSRVPNKKKKKWKQPLRDSWHDAQQVLSAAVASGKVVLKENWLWKATKQHQKNKVKDAATKRPRISYYCEDDTIRLENDDDDDNGDDDWSDYDTMEDDVSQEEIRQQEVFKSEKVMVELLQVEALWKVHKIGLNRVVMEACELILSGKYFFFPSHQSMEPNNEYPYPIADGWVPGRPANNNHEYAAIDVNEATERAASALVLIGNVMVQASKEGTAWME